MPALLTITIAGVVARVILVAIGARRVGDNPACGRCGYDLTGLRNFSGIGIRGVLRVGRIVRRPGLVAAGVVIAAVGVTPLTSRTVRDAARNPTPWKPSWLLAREVGRADLATRNLALREFAARHKAGRLDDASHRTVVATLLSVHGNPQEPWDREWSLWIERARRSGHASDEQWREYLRQTARHWYARMTIPVLVSRQKPIWMKVEHGHPRMSREATFSVESEAEVSFDDRPARTKVALSQLPSPHRFSSVWVPGDAVPFETLDDGVHTAVLHLTVRLYEGPDPVGPPAVEVPVTLDAWQLD